MITICYFDWWYGEVISEYTIGRYYNESIYFVLQGTESNWIVPFTLTKEDFE